MTTNTNTTMHTTKSIHQQLRDAGVPLEIDRKHAEHVAAERIADEGTGR